MRVDDTLAFLVGTWRIERALTDHRNGTRGTFSGRATLLRCPGPRPATAPGAQTGVPARGAETGDLARDEGAARYEETGWLRFGGHAGPARRSLLMIAAAGAADVRFADGRAFYPLDLRTGRWEARHRCGEDIYQFAFEVITDGLVRERWRVRGPGTCYDALTTFSRLAAVQGR